MEIAKDTIGEEVLEGIKTLKGICDAAIGMCFIKLLPQDCQPKMKRIYEIFEKHGIVGSEFIEITTELAAAGKEE